MIALFGNWYCKKCEKSTRILFIDVEDKEDIDKNSSRYCRYCLETKGIKRMKDITLYNQNLEEI